MSRIAIIPARGGSKRIPKKNIKLFLDKPIIAYSIEAALDSKLFDEVMVSTDDAAIAEIAKIHGATVPFLRSDKNADDYAILVDVLLEVLKKYKEENKTFEYVCCILPTAPFISEKKIQESFSKLVKNNFDSVFPVLEFSYPIQRALQIERGKISMVWNEYETSRSQDLEKRFHDSGQFYWSKTSSLQINKKLFTENSGATVISELEAQDIDTEIDWKLAEIKYKLLLEDEKNNL